MKHVCVPRLALMAKYLSSAGLRIFSCRSATYGVSVRTRRSSDCRIAYLQVGSRDLSDKLKSESIAEIPGGSTTNSDQDWPVQHLASHFAFP